MSEPAPGAPVAKGRPFKPAPTELPDAAALVAATMRIAGNHPFTVNDLSAKKTKYVNV